MNRSNKTKVFCFLAISLLGFLNSCEWDSSLYSEFVTNETISPCPPRVYYHSVNDTAYLVTRNPEAELYSDNTWVYSDENGNYIPESQRIRAVESAGQYYTSRGQKLVKWEIVEKYYNQGTVLPKLKYILLRTTTENNIEQEIQCLRSDSDSSDSHPECEQFSKSFQYNLCPAEYSSCEFDDDQKVFFCVKKNSGPKCNQASDCQNLMNGWHEGICDEGVCVPTACKEGFHHVENIGICDHDDSSNCGELGNACERGQVCSKGKCVSNCGEGEVFCRYDDAGKTITVCANPKSDFRFCGADGDCNNFQVCTDGSVCDEGTCTQNSCPNEGEELCVVNGKNTCIKTHDTDANHCGFCNYACKDHPIYNATSSGPATSDTCYEGKCVYECESDDENCGDDYSPYCFSQEYMKNDSSHCGSCTNVCSADNYCFEGKCVASRCSLLNQCLDAISGECVNEPEQCGTSCTNCRTANHAEDGTCIDGVCEITACAPGYRLTAIDDRSPLTCEKNEVNKCGRSNKNCPEAVEGWKDGYCSENGECIVASCKDGYHFVTVEGIGSSCALDGTTACGMGKTDCTKLPGWSSGSCQNGTCNASKCQPGYCLQGAACMNGQANSQACGTNGDACSICPPNHACINGTCKVISCGVNNQCYYNNQCVNNSDRCGTNCVNCNTANNAASGTCSNGSCLVNTCIAGYHKSNNSCVLDTDTACGEKAVNCKTTAGWSAGYCANSKCIATSCANTHHLSNGTCVGNTDTNCGPSGINCSTLTGVAKATCTNGACKVESCAANYHLVDNTCAANNTKEICGASKTDCTKQAGWKDGSCASGTCKASACDAGYHLNGNNCVADSTSECGASKTNCTKQTGWKNGHCVNGSCVLTGCGNNYCMSGGKCVDGRSAAATCGTDGGTCRKCGSNQKCSSGACVAK